MRVGLVPNAVGQLRDREYEDEVEEQFDRGDTGIVVGHPVPPIVDRRAARLGVIS